MPVFKEFSLMFSLRPYLSILSIKLILQDANVVSLITREGFLRKNIVAVSFFQNCAIHQYS